MNAGHGSKVKFVLVTIFIASSAGILHYSGGSESGNIRHERDIRLYGGSGELVPPAQNMFEIVASADAIVIGEIDSVVDSGLYEGYDGSTFLEAFTPTPPSSLGTPTPPPVGALPFIDLLIDEETVLKEDPEYEAWILRMASSRTANTSNYCGIPSNVFPPGAVGERYMFFLSRNPDGTYGLEHGPFDRKRSRVGAVDVRGQEG